MIKDSGNRTVFETGAVRDVQSLEKGRCDLLPLDVVATILVGGRHAKDTVLWDVSEFMVCGAPFFLRNAVREFADEAHMDIETLMLEVAIHFAEGAEKYSPDNWKKGIPISRYIDSAVRHYLKWRRGDKDERHDRAVAWNLMCAIWTLEHKPEMNDMKEVDT